MHRTRYLTIAILGCSLMAAGACCRNHQEGEHQGGSEGEEKGPRLAVNDTYDAVRKGVRLILAYDGASSSFTGTVKNVASERRSRVRVEVHLSDGTELGPTPHVDLEPGMEAKVSLPDEGRSFTWWKAHAESGEGEGEHDGEHEREHR